MSVPTPNLQWVRTGILPPVPVMQEDGGPAAYGCCCGDGCVLPGCSQCLGLSPPPSISPLGSWRDTLVAYWEHEFPVSQQGSAVRTVKPPCPPFPYVPPCVSQPQPRGAMLGGDAWCQLPSQSLAQEGLGLVGTAWDWAAKLVSLFPC